MSVSSLGTRTSYRMSREYMSSMGLIRLSTFASFSRICSQIHCHLDKQEGHHVLYIKIDEMQNDAHRAHR